MASLVLWNRNNGSLRHVVVTRVVFVICEGEVTEVRSGVLRLRIRMKIAAVLVVSSAALISVAG